DFSLKVCFCERPSLTCSPPKAHGRPAHSQDPHVTHGIFFPVPCRPGALPTHLVHLSFLPPCSRHRLFSVHRCTPRPHAGVHTVIPVVGADPSCPLWCHASSPRGPTPVWSSATPGPSLGSPLQWEAAQSLQARASGLTWRVLWLFPGLLTAAMLCEFGEGA
ncbi:unnamed protein product, partial [Gulo gulo]